MKKIVIILIAIGMALTFYCVNSSSINDDIAHENVMFENTVYKKALKSGLINNKTEYRLIRSSVDEDGRVVEYTVQIDNGFGWQDYIFRKN